LDVPGVSLKLGQYQGNPFFSFLSYIFPDRAVPAAVFQGPPGAEDRPEMPQLLDQKRNSCGGGIRKAVLSGSGYGQIDDDQGVLGIFERAEEMVAYSDHSHIVIVGGFDIFYLVFGSGTFYLYFILGGFA